MTIHPAAILSAVRPIWAGLLIAGFLVGACAAQMPAPSSSIAGLEAQGLVVPASESPNSALGDYLAGNFALDTGRLDEAASYFESALAKEPGNLDLLRQLFLLTLASGQYDRALDQANELVTADSAADEAHLLLALGAVRDDRLNAARDRLARLGDTGIAALTEPFIDAWARFGQGGANATEEAITRLDEGESLGPLNGYHRAMMLALADDLERARETIDAALPESGPAPPRLLQALAHIMAHEGQVDAARTLIEEQVAVRPDQPVLIEILAELDAGEVPAPPFTDPAGGMADALLGIAEALHQERGNARALVYARLSLFLQPELGEGALLIGDMMAEQENLEASIVAYREVDQASPFYWTAMLRTARALHNLERPEEAYSLLEELSSDDEERTEALVQLGDLLRRDEDYERAEVAYSQAIERIGDPDAGHWTLYYARGITFERTERWDQAEGDFLLALELQPEQPFVLNYLGYSWVDMGMNLDQAKGMLRRAVELRPNDGFIVDSLGWVYYRLGEYPAAVDRLEQAVELEPGDPVINDHLGDAYWRVGRHREARFQWRRALSLEPEDDQIALIEEKLKSGLPEPEPGTGPSRS